ncbi:NUDIX domain-containing protein [Allopontixanthobacter sediminis]|uniref:NUDIX domain-containing protein n=1 Tax=Allopontixanthobacter sediminis TaxID=1689985 RepID=A0A845AYI9_9SPHN|nr:NUDIX domain-containing protein [Allopontixanthobacter sediminis]MXP43008.1 NUDIX domain-containing protein [Allopontixanthobacter sediminis]
MPRPEDPALPDRIPAATVIVFRSAGAGKPPELLMVTRSRNMAFAGGAAVFPGGRVDPADYDLAAALAGPIPVDEAAHRVAAIRETLEETGLAIGVTGRVDADIARAARALLLEHGILEPVLAAMDWRLDIGSVLPFARWFPKNEKLPRLFDTRFYLADLGTGAVDITVDETENTRLYWISAADALAAAERGDLSVIFPTRRNLERLAQFPDFAAAAQDCSRFPVQTITPHIAEEHGQRWLCIPEDAGYPVTREPLDDVLRG